jgi:hypothetical protein
MIRIKNHIRISFQVRLRIRARVVLVLGGGLN